MSAKECRLDFLNQHFIESLKKKKVTKKELFELLQESQDVNQIYSTAVMMLWDSLVTAIQHNQDEVNYSYLTELIKSVEIAYLNDIALQFQNQELDEKESAFLVNNVKNASFVIWKTFLSFAPGGENTVLN